MDSGFRIHRNTGLCDLGSVLPTCESDIRLTRPPWLVKVEILHEGESLEVESSKPITINEVLEKLEIPPSTVLAVQGKTILPHTSLIKDDAKLELVVVSSGG
tara:strand:+ start:1702 stop:2007 length:306 start_codon:yes stop_codon:yes gene_type:complete